MGSFDLSGETRRQDTWGQFHALTPVALRHHLPTQARTVSQGRVRRLHLSQSAFPHPAVRAFVTTLPDRHFSALEITEHFAFETGCLCGKVLMNLWVNVVTH